MTRIDTPSAIFRRRLIAILIGAVVVRAGLLVFVSQRPAMFDFPDSHRYVRVARNIAAGLGPMETEQIKAGTDPGYPALLAIGVRLGVESTDGIMMFGRALNCACGVGLVVLVAFIGLRCFSPRVGLLAAGWMAVDPILLFFNGLALTEIVYATLLTASVLCILIYDDGRRVRYALFAGGLLGVGTLTRSSGILIPFAIALWVALGRGARVHRNDRAGRPGLVRVDPDNRNPSRFDRIIAAITLLLASAVVMTPTIYRNHRLFGEFVPVHTSGGATLLDSFGPWADGASGMDRIEYPAIPSGANEVERDRLYRGWVWDWVRAHPMEAIRLAGRKLTRTWSITMNAAAFQTGLYATICWLTVAPVFALAIFGVWRERRRRRLLALLLIPAAYFTLVHIVFVGSVRYRLPALPFIFLLAAVGMDALIDRSRRATLQRES